MLLTCLALQLTWWVSLGVYLSSEYQTILFRRLDKRITWSVFTFGTVLAAMLLSDIYHTLSAIVFVLAVVMSSWIYLAIFSQIMMKKMTVVCIGTIVVAFFSVLGRLHVA